MPLLTISIPFNPYIFHSGSFSLSWHGFFSFVGVAVAVYLVARWAKRDKINPDIVYNTAVFAIIGGIIGARVVHVADNWGYYSSNPGQIIAIWEGGIGLWGGILGGWLGGLAYAYLGREVAREHLVGKLMDLTAPAILIAQGIGRFGDIVNGEHCSRATSLPWGWVFTNPESPGRACALRFFNNPAQPVHPAVVYELILDFTFAFVFYKFRDRIGPPGALWMVYLATYATYRFAIQWLRLDPVKFWGLQEAHLIAILVLIVTLPWLVRNLKIRRTSESGEGPDQQPPRRRQRSGRRRQPTSA